MMESRHLISMNNHSQLPTVARLYKQKFDWTELCGRIEQLPDSIEPLESSYHQLLPPTTSHVPIEAIEETFVFETQIAATIEALKPVKPVKASKSVKAVKAKKMDRGAVLSELQTCTKLEPGEVVIEPGEVKVVPKAKRGRPRLNPDASPKPPKKKENKGPGGGPGRTSKAKKALVDQ